MTSTVPLRHTLIDAAREFNAGRYFEAHEVLEAGLDAVPDELWPLFIGLIQIAVGYHKLTQDLRAGAAQMLDRGLAKTAEFPTHAADLNLEALQQRARRDLAALRTGTFDAVAWRRDPPRLQPLAAAVRKRRK